MAYRLVASTGATTRKPGEAPASGEMLVGVGQQREAESGQQDPVRQTQSNGAGRASPGAAIARRAQGDVSTRGCGGEIWPGEGS